MSRSPNWCFTLNNPADNWNTTLAAHKTTTYIVGGTETGSSGTKHIQGFVQFSAKVRLGTLKQLLPAAHFEIMMGNSTQARDYCKKGEQSHEEWKSHGVKGPTYGQNADVYEHGTFKDVARTGGRLCPDKARSTGQKGGLKKAEEWKRRIELAETGAFDTLKDESPGCYFLHYNTIKRIAMDSPRQFAPLSELDNEWIHGPPGTGKSLTARNDNANRYFIKSLNKDWSGYRYEPVVILDDVGLFHFSNGMGDHLKQWADHYPYPVDIKYSGATIRPERIIVTSNYSIETLCGTDTALALAIRRRFKVRHFQEILKYDPLVHAPPKTPFNSEVVYPPQDHGILPSDDPYPATLVSLPTPSQNQDCNYCLHRVCVCFEESLEEVPEETCDREDLY